MLLSTVAVCLCRPPMEEGVPLRNGAPYSANSEIASSAGRPRRRRDYDDYNSSGDELDDDDFDRWEEILTSPS